MVTHWCLSVDSVTRVMSWGVVLGLGHTFLTLNEVFCVDFEPLGKAVYVKVISPSAWEEILCLSTSLWLLPKLG